MYHRGWSCLSWNLWFLHGACIRVVEEALVEPVKVVILLQEDARNNNHGERGDHPAREASYLALQVFPSTERVGLGKRQDFARTVSREFIVPSRVPLTQVKG